MMITLANGYQSSPEQAGGLFAMHALRGAECWAEFAAEGGIRGLLIENGPKAALKSQHICHATLNLG